MEEIMTLIGLTLTNLKRTKPKNEKSSSRVSRTSSMSVKTQEYEEDELEDDTDRGLWRDLLAFWLFGFCNNFGFVVMLAAAYDIISEVSTEFHSEENNGTTLKTGERPCNVLSTGVILLADVVPGLLTQFLSPFLPFWANVRVTTSCLFSITAFLIVAFAKTQWLALIGVGMTSLGSGLGEPTFLAYSAFFNKNVILTWSSGTGGAGIVGALAYTVLREIGLSNQQTLLIMICVPALELLVFYFLLRKPESSDIEDQEIGEEVLDENIEPLRSIKEKLIYIKYLLHFMIPIALIYFFEYFINQGLFELIHFPGIFLNSAQQYRWYQVTYQIGVLVSRSSVNLLHIRQIWIMAMIQGLNVGFFLFEAIYMFTPSIWIIFTLIVFEGLLGGGAYVNTYYRMSKEIPATRREYAMSVVTLSNTIGITIAGLVAMPTHNGLCNLPGGLRLQQHLKNVD